MTSRYSTRGTTRIAMVCAGLCIVAFSGAAKEVVEYVSKTPGVTYVPVGKKMDKYLHDKIIIAYDDLSFQSDKLEFSVQFENTSKTAFTLHVQTFFLDESGKRLNDQTPREVVKVPLNGIAEYHAIALNEKARRVEVRVSLLRSTSTNRRLRR